MAARSTASDGDSVKLHVGCGSVFLRGWLNVDLPLESVALARDEPGLVEEFITDESNYYGRHEGKTLDDWRKGPNQIRTVCDAYGSFEFLPARPKSADEILSRQCFEHLTIDRARPSLRECARVLKWGGHLRIDVPDPELTVEFYRQTGDTFYLRHLFGPRRDQYGFHSFYNRETLMKLAAEEGFNIVAENANIHPYPAFELEFVRS